MENDIREGCERFIENRDRIKALSPWSGALIHLAAASVFIGSEKCADAETLRRCRMLLKEKAGPFSSFRGYAKLPILAAMAAEERPEDTLDNALRVYELLKREFRASAYLPLAALLIARSAPFNRFDEISTRTRRVYVSLRSAHPLLTSGEDGPLCALLALSDKPESALTQDIEACYGALKSRFFSANAVQSLSCVLALYDAPAEEKCERTTRLFDALKASGNKYGAGHELPALGAFAMESEDPRATAEVMGEISLWLSRQKGFHPLSVTRKMRLMYAGMLAQKTASRQGAATANAIGGAISALIAQQAALCAAIAVSAASASNG